MLREGVDIREQLVDRLAEEDQADVVRTSFLEGA